MNSWNLLGLNKLRLLNLVRPKQLYLGEKDWQQLVILRQLVKELEQQYQGYEYYQKAVRKHKRLTLQIEKLQIWKMKFCLPYVIFSLLQFRFFFYSNNKILLHKRANYFFSALAPESLRDTTRM